tara:strand:+ start:540 stop:785 length:246 start_codon:yes stop_codon:yes gene_type:complete
MKTFEEHLAILYDEHLIAELETGKDICDIPLNKLRSPTMRALWKKQCSGLKKEKDSAIRDAAKKAGMSRKKRDKLHNEIET